VSQPDPVITSRDSVDWPEDWYPGPAKTFAKTARAVGWDVRIGFSRGYVPGQKADTWDVRDMIGVWLDGFDKRAVMLWERNPEAEFTAKKLEASIRPGEIPSGAKWSPKGGSLLLGNGRSFPWMNATQMKEWTVLKGAVLPSWYAQVRDEYFAAQDLARARARARADNEEAKEEEIASLNARMSS
jgi:hypothetical protein